MFPSEFARRLCHALAVGGVPQELFTWIHPVFILKKIRFNNANFLRSLLAHEQKKPRRSGARCSAVSGVRVWPLDGPAILASVEGLISPRPIVPTVPSVPAISVTFPSIPFPVPVPGAVVVVAIAGSRVIAEIEIDALR